MVIDSVDALSAADYAISGKTTALHLADPPAWNATPTVPLSDFTPRATAVYAQSERLDLAPQPNPNAITSTTIMLVPATSTTALQGQPIVVSGERADEPGITVSEVATVAEATLDLDVGATILTLAQPLQYSYVASTVTINGNVVEATHGQTVSAEVVGSSDGSANQSFTLNRPPLTYTPAAVAGGAQSTLALQVSGVDWTQVPTLYQLGPLDRGYVVRIDDDGSTHIIFGDGVHGASRPPGPRTSSPHTEAGSGHPDARRGPADAAPGPATRDRVGRQPARHRRRRRPRNARRRSCRRAADHVDARPHRVGLGLRELHRGLRGCWQGAGDHALGGQRQLVQLTVAGVAGAAFDGEALLTTAIQAAQDPGQLFAIDPYRLALFTVSGDVLIDPCYSPADASAALAAVQAAIAAAFSFGARAFAQPVSANEVVRMVMGVAGVTDTHVTGLARSMTTSRRWR